jgi:hypothetical protein
VPHTRLINVSTSAQLASALRSARPGDLIVLADGSYAGSGFKISTPATASAPSTICGTPNAIVSTTSNRSHSGIELSGADYWTVKGFTITNALFGIFGQRSSHFTIDGMTFHGIGQEAVEIFNFSKHLHVLNSRFYDTGTATAEWGEGVYIGSAYQKWPHYTGGQPDRSDSALVENNVFGPNVRAEHVDAKEGTTGGVIRHNVFNGAGMVRSQSWGPGSWVAVEGNGYRVYGNTGSTTIISGFRVEQNGPVPAASGQGNIFSQNIMDVTGAPYGFQFLTSPADGNVATCDNVLTNARTFSTSGACKP